jgi:phage tail sheath protein FI
MAEPTFSSAGVSLREIDNSNPSGISPSGVPAGVIGTSVRGPAFVPITVATFQDFISVFGNTDGEKFGPMAVQEWLNNAKSATYVKVLGVGNGQARSTTGQNIGKVTNSGFVVGQQNVQANGIVGRNPYNGSIGAGAPGSLGRTYFLSTLMSESAGSTIFSQAGLQSGPSAVPILRGILMAPSGVIISLSASISGVVNNTPANDLLSFNSFGPDRAGNAGANIGSVDISNAKQEFVILLNGLVNSDSYNNVLTASFDPGSPNYFARILNTDPTKLEKSGHYLYTHYDISPVLAVVTGSGVTAVVPADSNIESVALLLTSTLDRNTGTATGASAIGVPNFENFEDRYSHSFSPFVISQKFGGQNIDLFKFHSLSDGEVGRSECKITISNIQASNNLVEKYGQFDIQIRKFTDSDIDGSPAFETFRGVNLNPSSDRYIAKVIGDSHAYYDFDQPTGKQRLVIDGDYPNNSRYVRVELSTQLNDGSVDPSALPVGFRGLYHLVTSGTSVSGAGSILTGSLVSQDASKPAGSSDLAQITPQVISSVNQPPVPLRLNLTQGAAPNQQVNKNLTWGVQFELNDSLTETNKNNVIDASVVSFCKYFPNFHTSYQNPWVGDNPGASDVGGAVLDADRFNNNMFTLERVEVITSAIDRPDVGQWAAASYKRNGVLSGSALDLNNTWRSTRFLDPSKDFSDQSSISFYKFTLPMQGGFDGVNVFNLEKSHLTNTAVVREMVDVTNQFGKSGPTTAAYRKAIDVLKNKSDVDIQVLSIPGLRDPGVTDYAIETVEKRFDAFYIMDPEEKDVNSLIITGSANVNVTNTVTNFQSRGLDTSFAAAYFPDVVITDTATKTNVKCPPSVAVIGALALNDAVGYPWFAPAGFTRGALNTVVETQVKLQQANIDALYGVDINPIVKFQGSPSPVVFGQKTLAAAQTALDRINVRRLLIDIRRKIRNISNTFIFEPNREATLAAFSAAVTPELSKIQQQRGLNKFSVKIDTTTTTQADVENNTIRGKIFLQPTKSVEFISLDFDIKNAGSSLS